MFERFTDRARRVIVLSQEEARLLNHNWIGTEHLLLGLISEGEGIAAKALGASGFEILATRKKVEEEIRAGGVTLVVGHIPYTPRAKKVLEFSLREALQLGHNYIGTEHILLGMIREGGGLAVSILGDAAPAIRQAVIEQLGPAVPHTPSPPVTPESSEVWKLYRLISVTIDLLERGLSVEALDLLRTVAAGAPASASTAVGRG